MSILMWERIKDPDEVLDYELDWYGTASAPGDARGDTLTSSTWTVPAGITKNSDGFSDSTGVAKIWLSGGTAGEDYELLNRVTTQGGRTMDQTIKLRVRDR